MSGEIPSIIINLLNPFQYEFSGTIENEQKIPLNANVLYYFIETSFNIQVERMLDIGEGTLENVCQ